MYGACRAGKGTDLWFHLQRVSVTTRWRSEGVIISISIIINIITHSNFIRSKIFSGLLDNSTYGAIPYPGPIPAGVMGSVPAELLVCPGRTAFVTEQTRHTLLNLIIHHHRRRPTYLYLS